MTRDPFGHDTAVLHEPVPGWRPARQRPAPSSSVDVWKSKAVGGALVLLAIASALTIAGILMLSCSGHWHFRRSEGDTLVQEDEVSIPGGQQQDVYYPIPYASPPNLTIDDDMGPIVVVQQFPDHFRISNSRPFCECVTWKAKGLRAPTP